MEANAHVARKRTARLGHAEQRAADHPVIVFLHADALGEAVAGRLDDKNKRKWHLSAI